jgi:hypothetical protein
MAATETMPALIRRNMSISAVINAGFSLAFFLGVFGLPGRALAWAAPDRLALDFLPQSAAVALMSALVPGLVERKAIAAITGAPPRPVRAVVVAALGWSVAGLALGGVLAGAVLLSGAGEIAGWPAFALKLAYGAALGAVITRFALGRQRA